jgi:hypothetical protein
MRGDPNDPEGLLLAFAARVFVLAALAGLVGWVPLLLGLVVVGCWLVRCASNARVAGFDGTGERPAR